MVSLVSSATPEPGVAFTQEWHILDFFAALRPDSTTVHAWRPFPSLRDFVDHPTRPTAAGPVAPWPATSTALPA